MSSPSSMRIEMSWELSGRPLEIHGDVVLGGRWPRVEGFRCFDVRTHDELELADPEQDTAEDLLIEEAERIWRTP